jgi:HSP20 family protein
MTVSTRRGTKDVAPSRAPSALSLTAWPTWTDITQDFESVFSQFQRSFDELLAPLQPRTSPSVSDERSTLSPVVEVLDRGDHYTVTVELPGFSRDMVDVQVSRTGLVLRARKKEQTEDKRQDYHRSERSDLVFEHQLSFPGEVEPKKYEQTMKNGVLELRIPKREPTKPSEPVGKN